MKTPLASPIRSRQKSQAEFISRGLASLANARLTGDYFDVEVLIAKLQQRLELAKSYACLTVPRVSQLLVVGDFVEICHDD